MSGGQVTLNGNVPVVPSNSIFKLLRAPVTVIVPSQLLGSVLSYGPTSRTTYFCCPVTVSTTWSSTAEPSSESFALYWKVIELGPTLIGTISTSLPAHADRGMINCRRSVVTLSPISLLKFVDWMEVRK